MMPKAPAVLGCSIGTRNIGIAILHGSRIAHCRVSVFKGEWGCNKLHSIKARIDKYARRYHVTSLSLKVPSRTHHSPGLASLIASIGEYCTANGIKFHICTIKELKAYGAGEGRRNKKELVESLADKYPVLHLTAQKEQRLRNTYYTKMFEAVAAAELLQGQEYN